MGFVGTCWNIMIFTLVLSATLTTVAGASKSSEKETETMETAVSFESYSMDNAERASKCKDALPSCDAVANPAVCCMAKPVANASCQRACKFCHDINSIPGLGNVPGMGAAGTPPPVTVQNDPCNPGSAPGVNPGTGPNVGG